MKKTLLTSFMTASLLSSFTVTAAPPDYEGWAAGFAEWYNADNDKPEPLGGLEDGEGFGLELGIRLTPSWGTRLEWSHLNIDSQAGFDDESGDRLGIDALYFFDQKATYLFAGVKHESLDENYKLVNLGIGRHWTLNDRWKLVSELAAYHDFGEDFTDYGIKLGLAYRFGATSPAPIADTRPQPMPAAPQPMPEPTDSDGDGVMDDQDRCANTPPEDKVDANGCSIFTQERVQQQMDILFANDSYEIRNPDSSELRAFADFMKRFPNTEAVIEGHTSTVGDTAYNQQLSEKRANAVKELLVSQFGLSADRLSTIGYGELRPLDPANTAEAHRRNRRIEAVVSAIKEVKVTK